MSAHEILTKFQKQREQKENPKLRMECLVSLMKIGSEAVPALVDCMKNDKAPPHTRAFAAQALGLLADDRARPVLLQGIEDKDAFVAAHSRIALGRLGRQEATPKLRELAGEDDWSGRHIELTFALTRDDQPKMEPIRKLLREYDLTRMGSAQLDKPAPDFKLEDASGKTWRLRQFRDKKSVVLIFLALHN